MKKLCGVVVVSIVLMGSTAAPAAAAPEGGQHAGRGPLCKIFPRLCY